MNSHVLFAILTTIIVMPTTWLRDLSCLSYISGLILPASHSCFFKLILRGLVVAIDHVPNACIAHYIDASNVDVSAAGGVIASILVVICLFLVGVVNNVGFENEGTALNLPGIPIAIGLYGYCYSGHGVFPNIYSSLKNRNQFPSILFTW